MAFRILVLGAGGVGGFFGGRLVERGADVTFLVRERRAAQLARDGLVLTSPFGDFRSKVQHVTSAAEGGPYDLVLLTCKAYDLSSAMDAIAPAMAAGAAVVPLLNGMAHLDALDARFGAANVMGGLCFVAATLTQEGEVKQLNTLLNGIVFGERPGVSSGGERSARGEALLAAFAGAPVEARLSTAILHDMWSKWAQLAPLATLTCLMRAPVGIANQAEEGGAIALELIDECRAVAKAAGFEPSQQHLDAVRQRLTDKGSGLSASMLRDIERGGPIEAAHVIGDLLGRARALGVATPLLRVAYAHLQAYEAGRRQS